MNTLASPTAAQTPTRSSWPLRAARAVQRANALCARIPESLVAALARFSIAAVFWKSGQTKVQGFAIDLVQGEFHLGWPHLSDSAVPLFREEYRLPLLDPTVAAVLAASAEHLFPVLLLAGFATRLSAAALLAMTTVIEVFVYPDAYPTHGTWAAVLLFLMMRGGGRFSVDHWLATRGGAWMR